MPTIAIAIFIITKKKIYIKYTNDNITLMYKYAYE